MTKKTTILRELRLIPTWPVNPCLRWNSRDDMTIESGLVSNTYAHEITNIRNDGVFGWDFETEMTVEASSDALDFIAANYTEADE